MPIWVHRLLGTVLQIAGFFGGGIVGFFIASLLSQQTLSVKVAGLSLTGTIPGLVLAAAFAVMSYRGGGAKA